MFPFRSIFRPWKVYYAYYAGFPQNTIQITNAKVISLNHHLWPIFLFTSLSFACLLAWLPLPPLFLSTVEPGGMCLLSVLCLQTPTSLIDLLISLVIIKLSLYVCKLWRKFSKVKKISPDDVIRVIVAWTTQLWQKVSITNLGYGVWKIWVLSRQIRSESKTP